MKKYKFYETEFKTKFKHKTNGFCVRLIEMPNKNIKKQHSHTHSIKRAK